MLRGAVDVEAPSEAPSVAEVVVEVRLAVADAATRSPYCYFEHCYGVMAGIPEVIREQPKVKGSLVIVDS